MANEVFNDRKKSGDVRSKVLDCIQLVLDDDLEVNDWSDYKKDLIRRMSTSILPRLNELSGPDGGEIPLPIYGGLSKYDSNSKDIQTKEKD